MKKEVQLHQTLKIFRVKNNFTQAEFAEMMNITASQYCKIENGKSHLNIHHIEAVANNMGQDFTAIYSAIKGLAEDPIKPESLQDSVSGKSIDLGDAINKLKEFCEANNCHIKFSKDGSMALEPDTKTNT